MNGKNSNFRICFYHVRILMDGMRKMKYIKSYVSIVVVLCIMMFVSCSSEIGEHVSASQSSKLFVQDTLNRWTEMQIWTNEWGGESTVAYSENRDAITITATSSWLNGVAFAKNDAARYFDFSDVAYMSFNVRGTLPLERTKVYIMGLGTYGDASTLYDYVENPEEYGETATVKVQVPLEGMSETARGRIDDVFVIVASNDNLPSSYEEGAYELKDYQTGQYVEISEIDFLDENLAHVEIGFERPEFKEGSFDNILSSYAIDDLELQSWESTSILEVRDTGLRVYSLGSTWFGGAISTVNGDVADFSDVASMSFEIRGSMSSDQVKIGFNVLGGEVASVLSALDGAKTINEEEFVTYELSVPDEINELQRRNVSQILTFCQGNEYSGVGEWLEIRNVTYKDKEGNAIRIKLTPPDALGDWTNLFSSIDLEATPIDLQVWDGTFSASFTNEGLKVIPSASWFGGGIVNELANLGETVYEAFDFSDIESMSFNIKGTIRPEGLRVYVGGAENQVSWPEGALSSIGVLDINEDDWTEVRIEIPDTLTLVNMPLAFANAGDADDWNATYFIIADVTYYDVSGNNVTLKYSN